MKTLEYIENYNAYQPYMLLNFNLSFEKDIAHDDICRTVIEVVEEVNIAKYVDFTNRNAWYYVKISDNLNVRIICSSPLIT